jgi:hypothetical protein
VIDQCARTIREEDNALDLPPVSSVTPASVLVAMPESSPAVSLLISMVIHDVEGIFSGKGMIVIGSTPNNRGEGRNQCGLRVAPVGAGMVLAGGKLSNSEAEEVKASRAFMIVKGMPDICFPRFETQPHSCQPIFRNLLEFFECIQVLV